MEKEFISAYFPTDVGFCFFILRVAEKLRRRFVLD
jgi:hypothetical protein